METWLTSNFVQMYGGIVVYTINGVPTIAQTSISSQLGTTVPPTHTELSALPIAQQGWQKIFDQWKADGKVS